MHKLNETDTLVGNQSGCDVDENGNTLLHQALLRNYIYGDTLLYLLVNGKVDVNAINNDGQTALHLVAGRINIPDAREILTTEKLVKLLIENGIQVDAKDNHGNTALHVAVGLGTSFSLISQVMQVLQCRIGSHLANPNLVSAYGYSLRQYSSMIETLSKVCDLNVSNSSGKTALHIAAENGKFQVVTTLLAAICDVDTKDNEGNTALHCTLLDKRYVGHNSTILTALLAKGADVNIKNVRGETPMHLFIDCCVNNSNSIWEKDLKLLLSSAVDINVQDEKGETCLIRAVRKNINFIVVEYILMHNALLNLTDNKGNSVLHYAALSKSQAMMKKLIDAGADCNLQNTDGKTPLHLLFQLYDSFNNFDIKNMIKLSLSRGFDVNLQDRNGDTLLHLATQSYWRDELLNVLIVKGARIDVENRKGESVADIYIENLYQTCSDVDMIKLTEARVKYYMTSGINVVVHDTLRSEFFKTSCLKELAQMRKTKMGSIFFRYDDPVNVADVELEQMVTSDNVMHQFPIYGILLIFTYERAKRRNHLLDVLSYNLDISGNPETPLTLISEIKRIILSYLSDKDLSNLLKAIGLQKSLETQDIVHKWQNRSNPAALNRAHSLTMSGF